MKLTDTKPTDYRLREIPPDLHRKMRIAAAENNIPMRSLILRGIELAVEELNKEYRREK